VTRDPAPQYLSSGFVKGVLKILTDISSDILTTFVSTSSATWPERLIHDFDAADTTATELITGLNREQLNHHPSPAAWSIGQCLEHLCIFNEVYLPPIASALQGRHGSAVQEISPGWFERWFINNFVEPSPRTKLVAAPRKVVPHPIKKSSFQF